MLGIYSEVFSVVFALVSVLLACCWVKSQLTYTKTTTLDSPIKGNLGDPIVLYGWAKLPTLPGDRAIRSSPYVGKVETWLRFAQLPYTYEGTLQPANGPKGQVPYIKHGKNVVADSAFIIKYLQATYGNPPPNSALQPLDLHQQALSTACSTIAMERLAWFLTYHRFVPLSGWSNFRVMLSSLPLLLKPILYPYMRATFVKRLYTQGFARHSERDVSRLLHDDLAALSAILGDNPYLLGEAPCEADAAMFSVLEQIIYGQAISPEAKQILQQYPSLCKHTKRVRDTFFPDFPVEGVSKSDKSA